MAIRKQSLEKKPVCKVTFKIPEEIGNTATQAHVVGDFNDWSISATPMKRLKDGGFSVTVDLDIGRSYQFRYLLGQDLLGKRSRCRRLFATPFGDSPNSVINL